MITLGCRSNNLQVYRLPCRNPIRSLHTIEDEAVIAELAAYFRGETTTNWLIVDALKKWFDIRVTKQEESYLSVYDQDGEEFDTGLRVETMRRNFCCIDDLLSDMPDAKITLPFSREVIYHALSGASEVTQSSQSNRVLH